MHAATVLAADSPRLAKAYEPLVAELRLSLVPVRLYMSVSELAADHAELFRAIESGDGDAARRRFMQHLALSSRLDRVRAAGMSAVR